MPRTLIIYNPTAGRARRAIDEVRAVISAMDSAAYEIYETTGPGTATTRTRAALSEGYTTIAAVGGDGTLGETATGFFDLDNLDDKGWPAPVNPRAVFAPLPAGTGNDFTRALANGRPEPLSYWLHGLTAYLQGSGRTRLVDALYGTTDGGTQRFVALNMVTLGLSVAVIRRVRAQGTLLQQLPGGVRFVWAALGALAAWREQPVSVTLDDNAPRRFATNLLTFANSPYAGGGMMFAPNAQLDDSWLDALLSGGLSRAGILRELPRIRHGGHVANPKVTIRQARRVSVTAPDDTPFYIEADSNLLGQTPLTLRVMPGTLQVVCESHYIR